MGKLKYYIHVEKAWDERVWNNLLKFIRTHDCHLFLMPPSYAYQKSVLGYRGTEKQLNDILAKRYKQLRKHDFYKIGLHLHVSLYPAELPEKDKEDMLMDSLSWMYKLFPIDGISFGWFKCDEYLRESCKKKNLRIMHFGNMTVNIHDYDLPIKKSKVAENFIKDRLRELLR